MIPRLRSIVRATLVLISLLALMPFVATPARAIQLRWSTGATDLTVSQNTQAILVVQADSSEVTLSDSWTLQWTADSTGIRFSAFDPSQACLVDTAKVDSIIPPQTAADSAANLIKARFCSDGSTNAATAHFLAELTGDTHGKLKVVALDPADTTQVIESNEVTFNGGIGGDYAPVVLRVTSDHSTTTLRVEAIGADLTGIQSMSISAPEMGATIPLSLVVRTDPVVVASAEIAMPLPTCEVRFGTPDQQFTLGDVPADQVLMTPLPYRLRFPDPESTFVYPKDFALIDAPLLVSGQWQRVYHLYYIRSYKDGRPKNEYALGHAWSRDLEHWKTNLFAFVADTLHPANWDGAHVWAPSIIRFRAANNRDTCIMFYTGVNSAGDETIGYAAASNIDTIDAPGHWTRRSTATLTPLNAQDWVDQNHAWGFRDPFVMADPENPMQYLLFYAARMQADPAHLAVGVFRSQSGTFDGWSNLGHYAVTEFGANGARRLESPHVFPDASHSNPAQSAAATWRMMYTDGDWTDWRRAVQFNTKSIGTPLTDTQASSWPGDAVGLGTYLNLTTLSPEYGVQASEILQIWGTDYWGGYNGDELVFRKLQWSGTDFALADVDFLAVDPPDLKRAASLRLTELRFGGATVRLRVELPAAMRANVAIYDVMGRVVRTLADRDFTSGATEVAWDGRDRSGAAVSSGIYFARLRVGGASHVVRVPFVR